MNTEAMIRSLESFPAVLSAAASGVSAEDARWRPAGGGWSVLEIVSHVAVEETRDFRQRLSLTLADPARDWPPIDPEGDVAKERFNDGDLGERLARFAAERAESGAWLRALQDPDWSLTHDLPRFSLRAGDLMAAWTAHDWLHLKQLALRRVDLVKRDAGEYETTYAG